MATVRTPGLYSLLWQAYSSQTRSFFSEDEFITETGLSPIGPQFALSVDETVRGVKSELNVWYSDDATLGDYPERVQRRFTGITGEAQSNWLGGQWKQT